MDKYIIYSGGGNGYGLYGGHPDFPEKYKSIVRNLYEKQHIAGPYFSQEDRLCYRFAPAEDCFIFSVIYKDCTCAEESRSFFASVNWLLTADEADKFFESKIQNHFSFFIVKSDDILRENGYIIPDIVPNIAETESELTENAQKALFSSAYYSAKASAEADNRLNAQVFLGCSKEEGLFNSLFGLINNYPPLMRKYLSFHIGASAISETFGVALVITYNEILSQIIASGNYSGAMAVKKIILVNDSFSTSALPPVVEEYYHLPSEDIQNIYRLFSKSDCCTGYWKYIASKCNQDMPDINGIELVDLLGENAALNALRKGFFSDEEIAQISAQAETLTNMPELVEELKNISKSDSNNKLEEIENITGWDIVKVDEQTDKPDIPINELQNKMSETEEKETSNNFDEEEKQLELQAKYENEIKKNKEKSGKKGKHQKEDGKVNKKDKQKDKDKDKDKDNDKQRRRKLIAQFLETLWICLKPILYLVISVCLGIGIYKLGIMIIPKLPPYWASVAYGVQIFITFVLAMPLGYLFISHMIDPFKTKKNRKETKEEDSH